MSQPLVDAVGTVHQPASADARIVSLVPSITELVIDLGLTDRLVGRTHYCIHPADVVKHVPSLGGTKKASLPKLRALEPTHVILNVDENTREMAQSIGEFVPNLIVTHPVGPDDNPPLYRLIGGVFGKRAEAEALCADFEAAYDDLKRRGAALPTRKVLYLIWKDPWMTVSRDTYVSRLLETVGWTTLCHDANTRYPEVVMSPALLEQTDLILFSSEPYAFVQDNIDRFSEEFECAGTTLRLIDGEYTSWYGTRAIPGMRYLADFATAGL